MEGTEGRLLFILCVQTSKGLKKVIYVHSHKVQPIVIKSPFNPVWEYKISQRLEKSCYESKFLHLVTWSTEFWSFPNHSNAGMLTCYHFSQILMSSDQQSTTKALTNWLKWIRHWQHWRCSPEEFTIQSKVCWTVWWAFRCQWDWHLQNFHLTGTNINLYSPRQN